VLSCDVEERAEYDRRRVAAAQARGGDDSGLTGMTMGVVEIRSGSSSEGADQGRQ
jgi:hypothetical protein